MPNPPKKFLSKAERQAAVYEGRRSKFYNQLRLEGKDLDEYNLPFYPTLRQAFGDLRKRGATAPSSQVKKAKMSGQKLTKMGDAINTGLTGERAQVLKRLSKLPPAQLQKIMRALTEGGYAME